MSEHLTLEWWVMPGGSVTHLRLPATAKTLCGHRTGDPGRHDESNARLCTNCSKIRSRLDKAPDLGMAYSERMTAPHPLTPEDEAMIRSMLEEARRV